MSIWKDIKDWICNKPEPNVHLSIMEIEKIKVESDFKDALFEFVKCTKSINFYNRHEAFKLLNEIEAKIDKETKDEEYSKTVEQNYKDVLAVADYHIKHFGWNQLLYSDDDKWDLIKLINKTFGDYFKQKHYRRTLDLAIEKHVQECSSPITTSAE